VEDRRLAFKGYIYAQIDQFDDVKNTYDQISQNYIYKEYLSLNLETISKIVNAKEKKPLVAGFLGVIPGAGYIYSGHTTTGISSLVLNGLLGYATYTSFKSENYGVGILTGMFSTAFYIGNISGGYKAAKRYNETQKINFRKKLMYSFN
jgi:TM2 domain-containing membrane protein YozV